MCARRPASLAVAPAVCVRGLGAGAERECVVAFVGLSGCVSFVWCPPSLSVAPSGLLCEGGRSPFVCASPGRTRTLAPVGARVTPSLGGGSAGLSAGGHGPVCPLPAPLCPRWFFPATAWAPWRCGSPRLCHCLSPGVRLLRARGRASCSRDSRLQHRPPGGASSRVPARALRLGPVECVIRSSFASVRERSCTPLLCLVFSTSAPPVFVRMAAERGEGTGREKSVQCYPVHCASSEHPSSPSANGKGGQQRVWPAAP